MTTSEPTTSPNSASEIAKQHGLKKGSEIARPPRGSSSAGEAPNDAPQEKPKAASRQATSQSPANCEPRAKKRKLNRFEKEAVALLDVVWLVILAAPDAGAHYETGDSVRPIRLSLTTNVDGMESQAAIWSPFYTPQVVFRAGVEGRALGEAVKAAADEAILKEGAKLDGPWRDIYPDRAAEIVVESALSQGVTLLDDEAYWRKVAEQTKIQENHARARLGM